MKINDILKSPIQTEKSTQLLQKSYYSFEVNQHANKFQIKSAVEKLFNVKVDGVKVIVRKGKIKKVGRRMRLKKLPDKRIAYIKLKEGHIDLFPRE